MNKSPFRCEDFSSFIPCDNSKLALINVLTSLLKSDQLTKRAHLMHLYVCQIKLYIFNVKQNKTEINTFYLDVQMISKYLSLISLWKFLFMRNLNAYESHIM